MCVYVCSHRLRSATLLSRYMHYCTCSSEEKVNCLKIPSSMGSSESKRWLVDGGGLTMVGMTESKREESSPGSSNNCADYEMKCKDILVERLKNRHYYYYNCSQDENLPLNQDVIKTTLYLINFCSRFNSPTSNKGLP